ncbi:MAG TPA: hypothetical protein VNL98_08890, partial [Gemmatimonadales bacterium]|nr:hypothetical protein [Gemmatimonadales bacterium]
PPLAAVSFGLKIAVTAFGTMAIWVPVMFLTPPEPEALLDSFYRRARPGGPGWGPVRARTGLEPASALADDLAGALTVVAMVMGAMLGTGGVVVGSWQWAVGGGAAVAAGLSARRLKRVKGQRAEGRAV